MVSWHAGLSAADFDTHVGSLIRSLELIAYYKTIEQALDGGPPVDQTAFENCVRNGLRPRSSIRRNSVSTSSAMANLAKAGRAN